MLRKNVTRVLFFSLLLTAVLVVAGAQGLPEHEADNLENWALIVQGDDMDITVREPVSGGLLVSGSNSRIDVQTHIDGDTALYGKNASLHVNDRITGHLTVNAEADAVIEDLKAVDGTVSLQGPASLPALHAVGGDLILDTASAGLAQLQEVSGSVFLNQPAALSELHTVTGDVEINSTDVKLDGLQLVGGSVTINETIAPEHIAALETVAGDLVINAPDIVLEGIAVAGTLEFGAGADNVRIADGAIAWLADTNHEAVENIAFEDVHFENLYTGLSGGSQSEAHILGREGNDLWSINAGRRWSFSEVRWPLDGEGMPLSFGISVGAEQTALRETPVPGRLHVGAHDFSFEGKNGRPEVAGEVQFRDGAENALFGGAVLQGAVDLSGAAAGEGAPLFLGSELQGPVAEIPPGTLFSESVFSLSGGDAVEVQYDDVVFSDCTFQNETEVRVQLAAEEDTTVFSGSYFQVLDRAALLAEPENRGRIYIDGLHFHDQSRLAAHGAAGSAVEIASAATDDDAELSLEGSGERAILGSTLAGSVLINGPGLDVDVRDSRFYGALSVLRGDVTFGASTLSANDGTVVAGSTILGSPGRIAFFHTIIESEDIVVGSTAQDLQFNHARFRPADPASVSVLAGEGAPVVILNNTSFRGTVAVDGTNIGGGDDLAVWLRGNTAGKDGLSLAGLDVPRSQLGPHSQTSGVTFDFDLEDIDAHAGAQITDSHFTAEQRINRGIEFENNVFSAPAAVSSLSTFRGDTFADDLELKHPAAVLKGIVVRAGQEDKRLTVTVAEHAKIDGLTVVEEDPSAAVQLLIQSGQQLTISDYLNWEQAPNLRMVQESTATLNWQGAYVDPQGEDQAPPLDFAAQE